jgi:hypothetical protein
VQHGITTVTVFRFAIVLMLCNTSLVNFDPFTVFPNMRFLDVIHPVLWREGTGLRETDNTRPGSLAFGSFAHSVNNDSFSVNQ